MEKAYNDFNKAMRSEPIVAADKVKKALDDVLATLDKNEPLPLKEVKDAFDEFQNEAQKHGDPVVAQTRQYSDKPGDGLQRHQQRVGSYPRNRCRMKKKKGGNYQRVICKIDKPRNKNRVLEPGLVEQFKTGRLYKKMRKT